MTTTVSDRKYDVRLKGQCQIILKICLMACDAKSSDFLVGLFIFGMTIILTFDILTLCKLDPAKQCILVNSKNPDEMQHHAAFYQGLLCLLRSKKKHHNFETSTCILLKYKLGNPILIVSIF